MTKSEINELINRHNLMTDPSSITRLLINIENDISKKLDKLPLDTRVDDVERHVKRIFTKYISEIIKKEGELKNE